MFLRCFKFLSGGQIRNISTSGKVLGKLSGKSAIVTASTDGIGFAIARKLGLDGASVIVSSRKQENVDKAVAALKEENINVIGMICHAGKSSDRAALMERAKQEYGGLDILVTNTGINPYYGGILDTPEAAFDKIFEMNVKSTFLTIKEAVPLMKDRKNPSILIVSSIAGYTPLNLLGIYSVSKTTLIGLTKALTPELAAKNIRINCLAPGIIKTKFSGALWKNPEAEKAVMSQVPLGRLGTSDDCAGIVSHLASDESSYITGETIVVSGGMTSRL